MKPGISPRSGKSWRRGIQADLIEAGLKRSEQE
jgi:hypothetical protein